MDHAGVLQQRLTLLGLAMSNITGQSMEQLYHDAIFAPLDMTSSFSSPPPPDEYHRSVQAIHPPAELPPTASLSLRVASSRLPTT